MNKTATSDLWIQTYTGRRFYPLAPKVEDICIEDIAHALSLKCRFTGHCKDFYSVAQHSVHVAQRLPKELQLYGLLHDAAEAYLPDVARPIKGEVYFGCYDGTSDNAIPFHAVEWTILRRVAEAFGLDYIHFIDARVRDADVELLSTEARDLMGGAHTWPGLVTPVPYLIQGMAWYLAKDRFLTMFRYLTGMEP